MAFIGKGVIITGSSFGIGRFTALEFARQGANVLILGRDKKSFSETVQKCYNINKNGKFPSLAGDITEDDHLKDVVATAKEEFGSIDVLFNSAGDHPLGGNLKDGSMELLDRFMKVFLRAPIRLSQLCLPELQKSRGNIVNMSSFTSFRVWVDDMHLYQTCNAGVNMFTKCAAVEFGRLGVRVNALCIGFCDTPTKVFRHVPEVKTDADFIKVIEDLGAFSQTPMGKLVPIGEIGKMVAFMASRDASMLNGACIPYDGGISLTGLDNQTLDNALKARLAEDKQNT